MRTGKRVQFPKLAVADIMAVCAGGIALSWACHVHPSQLPFWLPWEFSWPEYLATTLVIWCYGRGLARTAPAARPGWARTGCFLAGTLATYAVLQTHFDYLAQHMFAMTRLQHLTTHHLGPFLIALSHPATTLRRGLPRRARTWLDRPIWFRLLAVLQQPVVAGVLFVGLIFVWLIPPVLFRAMLDQRLYAVMNWSMVLDGLLFWSLVLDERASPPARLSRGGRLVLVFAVQWPQIAGGAVIGFAERSLYPYYLLCGRVFPSIGAQTDQQIGGFAIWFGGGMMSALAALIILRGLWAEEERRARVTIPGWDARADAGGRSSPSA